MSVFVQYGKVGKPIKYNTLPTASANLAGIYGQVGDTKYYCNGSAWSVVAEPSGNINLTNTASTDVTNYATAQVVDANLVASNIKKDTTILGVVGSYEGIIPSGSLSITTNGTYDVTDKASVNVNVSGGGSSLSATSNTYFGEYNGNTIVGYLFYIEHDSLNLTATYYSSATKDATAMRALMATNTLRLSYTDTSSVTLNYGSSFAYSPTVSSQTHDIALGTVADIITFVKSDGVTPFTTSDITEGATYSFNVLNANWSGNLSNMTNFTATIAVIEE